MSQHLDKLPTILMYSLEMNLFQFNLVVFLIFATVNESLNMRARMVGYLVCLHQLQLIICCSLLVCITICSVPD